MAPWAGRIDRTGGDPWPAHGLTSALWLQQPVCVFAIHRLTVTQPGILFDPLTTDTDPYGGDPYPHVVIWRDTRYLEDGHHRLIRALIAGHTTITARWIRGGT